jgi:hypothetical protein
MKIKDKKYCASFRDCPCLIRTMLKEYSNTDEVCGHHLDTRLRDDRQIPLEYYFHTGDEGVHTIGKKTWHDKYLSKEDCIDIAEFAYGFWKTNSINLFSLNNIQEIMSEYFKETQNETN